MAVSYGTIRKNKTLGDFFVVEEEEFFEAG